MNVQKGIPRYHNSLRKRTNSQLMTAVVECLTRLHKRNGRYHYAESTAFLQTRIWRKFIPQKANTVLRPSVPAASIKSSPASSRHTENPTEQLYLFCPKTASLASRSAPGGNHWRRFSTGHWLAASVFATTSSSRGEGATKNRGEGTLRAHTGK